MSVYNLSSVNILSTFICRHTALRSSFRLRNIFILIYINIFFPSESAVLHVLFALYSLNKSFFLTS